MKKIEFTFTPETLHKIAASDMAAIQRAEKSIQDQIHNPQKRGKKEPERRVWIKTTPGVDDPRKQRHKKRVWARCIRSRRKREGIARKIFHLRNGASSNPLSFAEALARDRERCLALYLNGCSI